MTKNTELFINTSTYIKYILTEVLPQEENTNLVNDAVMELVWAIVEYIKKSEDKYEISSFKTKKYTDFCSVIINLESVIYENEHKAMICNNLTNTKLTTVLDTSLRQQKLVDTEFVCDKTKLSSLSKNIQYRARIIEPRDDAKTDTTNAPNYLCDTKINLSTQVEESDISFNKFIRKCEKVRDTDQTATQTVEHPISNPSINPLEVEQDSTETKDNEKSEINIVKNNIPEVSEIILTERLDVENKVTKEKISSPIIRPQFVFVKNKGLQNTERNIEPTIRAVPIELLLRAKNQDCAENKQQIYNCGEQNLLTRHNHSRMSTKPRNEAKKLWCPNRVRNGIHGSKPSQSTPPVTPYPYKPLSTNSEPLSTFKSKNANSNYKNEQKQGNNKKTPPEEGTVQEQSFFTEDFRELNTNVVNQSLGEGFYCWFCNHIFSSRSEIEMHTENKTIHKEACEIFGESDILIDICQSCKLVVIVPESMLSRFTEYHSFSHEVLFGEPTTPTSNLYLPESSSPEAPGLSSTEKPETGTGTLCSNKLDEFLDDILKERQRRAEMSKVPLFWGICLSCRESFNSPLNWRYHLDSHGTFQWTDKDIFICSDCCLVILAKPDQGFDKGLHSHVHLKNCNFLKNMSCK